jgi:predicted ArsR family transcriptional regulator
MAKRTALPSVDPVELRARALAEPARRQVWEAVRNAARPIGIAELARSLHVHPNTIRLHLARLVDAGLVTGQVETHRHPGRPGYRYRATGTDPISDAAAYRRLAGLLAHAVRSSASARDAGLAFGAAEAAKLAGADPVAGMVDTLVTQGFAPEAYEVDAERVDIVLHACPFADAAAEDPATICQLHLGLAEGAAQAIGGLHVDKLRINDPHEAGCLLHLRRVTQPLRRT